MYLLSVFTVCRLLSFLVAFLVVPEAFSSTVMMAAVCHAKYFLIEGLITLYENCNALGSVEVEISSIIASGSPWESMCPSFHFDGASGVEEMGKRGHQRLPFLLNCSYQRY